MKHAKESGAAADFFYKLYLSYIPNKRDNVKQIIVKIFFLLSLAVLIVSASYLTNYFLCGKKQESIIEKSRTAWHNAVSAENDTESAVEIMAESPVERNMIFLPNFILVLPRSRRPHQGKSFRCSSLFDSPRSPCSLFLFRRGDVSIPEAFCR